MLKCIVLIIGIAGWAGAAAAEPPAPAAPDRHQFKSPFPIAGIAGGLLPKRGR
ncbi:MAG: hypothetical protein JNM29_01810 [Candidatus Odyssella sp.]|nr:hypothetical protein [Candidatus Odyssella sp.]